MDIRELITFTKIVQTGTFAKAAEALNYAPSTVTAQIKSLEKEFGVLFERNAFGVSLTPRGQAILPFANQILEINTSMQEIVQDETKICGPLRVGSVETLCVHVLPYVIRHFQKYYPSVEFSVEIGSSRELHKLLLSNQVDLILTLEEPQNSDMFCCGWSRQEDIIAVVSENHPLAKEAICEPAELIQYPLVLSEKGCSYRQYLLSWFQMEHLQPNVFLEVGNTEMIKNFILSGFAVGYLPRFAIRQEIQERKIVPLSVKNLNASMASQLLYLKDTPLTPAMKKMISTLRDEA